MKNPIIWKSIIPALLIMLGCSSGNERGEVMDKNENTVTSLMLTASQTDAAGIETGKITRKSVELWTDATGIVDLPPGEISSVYPRHEGYVTKVKVLSGSKVKRGEILGFYEHPHLLDMQLEYLKAKEQLKYLDSVLHREQILGEENAVPLKNIQSTLNERNQARLEEAAKREKLKIIGIDPGMLSDQHLISSLPLKSIIEGFIETVNIHPGMYITPETLCFKIFGTLHQHVELTVFRDQLEQIKEGQRVRFSLAGSNVEYEGEVFLIKPAIDPTSTTATIHVHFDDEKINLTTGSRVNASISILQDSIYTIDKDELIRIGDQFRIFTVEDNAYHPNWVTTGKEGNDWIEITGPEDIFKREVVLKGNYYLQGSL